MRIVFFSARNVQHSYFEALCQALISRGHDSKVLWHKSLWLNSFWLCNITVKTNNLDEIITHYIHEKKNASAHRNHSSFYWAALRCIKRIETHCLFMVYYSALKKAKPDSLIMWNGLKFRQSIVLQCAKELNIQCLFMENGLIPGMTTIDASGINFLNSIPRNPEFFLHLPQQKPVNIQLPHSEKPDSLPEQYIFVPFQVNTDTQVTRFSPWIKNTRELVDVFCTVHQQLGTEMPVIVFKPHPHGDEDIPSLVDKLKPFNKLLIIDDIPTPTLIEHADAVATINSTVGIEALIAYKKVILLGDAFFQIHQLTLPATHINMLRDALINYPEWPLNKALISSFLSYMVNDYQIEGSWREKTPTHISLMCNKIIQLSEAP